MQAGAIMASVQGQRHSGRMHLLSEYKSKTSSVLCLGLMLACPSHML